MRADAPTPTKREILPPITGDHLDHFVHPGGVSTFEAPFLPPADQQTDDPHTYAANGYLCHRTTYAIPDISENPRAYERAQKLPWHLFQTFDTEGHAPRWQPLEHARPLLFKFPAKPIWSRTTKRFHLTPGPIIRVGGSLLAHLPLVQLLSRLPRAEVFLSSEIHAPLLVRYRYGQAIAMPLNKMFPQVNPEDCRFTILRPRNTHGPAIPGGLV